MERYVELGVSEGAELVVGGTRPADPALADGFFFLPTIFDHCHRSVRVVREETFGPILTVERFATVEQAIALGNDTGYGLAAGVRTADPELAGRVATALRHGTVWIDDFGCYTPAAEW
jgi:betaine-aldehyde dehydrogenase